MKQRSICKRCHRLRVINGVGHCVHCEEVLRNMEKPRRYAAISNSPYDQQDEEHSLAEASTEPPPPESA